MVLHAVAFAAIGLDWFALPAPPDMDRAELRPEQPEPETVLGIDDSKAVTMTWLGFQADPAPQQAPRAEVEQAAQRFSEQPAPVPDPQGGEADTSPQQPDQQPDQPREPQPDQPTELETESERESQGQSAPAQLQGAAPEPEVAAVPEAQQPETQASPADDATDPAPVSPASAPASAGGGAERDSDAFTLEPPLEYTPGQPVAREGLEIITKYIPVFRSLVLIRRPNNPIIRFTFGHDGKAARVRYVERDRVVYDTGDEQLNEVMLNGLYQWGAKGAAIDELAPGETISVEIRMNLR